MEQQPQSVLGGAPAAPAAGTPTPKKKSNAGLIVAIIVAALILVGGAVAAVLIIVNSNNGKKDDETSKQESKKDDDKEDDESDDEDDEDEEDEEDEDEEDEDDGEVATNKPYNDNSSYFININGKKYNFNNTISEVEKTGFKLNSQAKDKTVPTNSYLILIGASRLTDSDSDGFGFTAYNDGSEKVTVPNAKLGAIDITTPYNDKAKAKIQKITVYGGIHIGSTVAQLKKAFGEPTKLDEASYGDTYEYKVSTYKYYSFKVKDGVVDEIKWTNYGKLVR